MCEHVSVSPRRSQSSIGVNVSTCCGAASPYITPHRVSTVCRLESLPRLPSQHGERSEALFFFNPAECTGHICPPACITSHPLCSLLPSVQLPPASFWLSFQDSVVFVAFFLGGFFFCQLMLFAAFVVIDSCFFLSFSLLFLSHLGCTFHEDDFSIKCPKHEVRKLFVLHDVHLWRNASRGLFTRWMF